MTTPATVRIAVGAYGENRAEQHLLDQGMIVLDRNWRCNEGEIDLVLRDGRVLVVCEVKTRRGRGCGTPHEALTPTKLERLRRLAMRWASEQGIRPADVRVDLVAVLREHDTGAATIEHVRGL
jgi:putative endonuclease